MDKFLIVGAGGREASFALNLKNDTQLFSVLDHKNPTIIDCVAQTGGAYLIANSSDPAAVASFAKAHQINFAFVSADGPLASGVVDALLAAGIKTVGGTKAATRIEWDKIYSIDLVKEVCGEYTPFYKVLSKDDDAAQAVAIFKAQGRQVVVKPQGLTGGKGVKVMPEHLPTYQDAVAYAEELQKAKSDEQVLLVEKLEGIEFTIMGLTDGEKVVMSPASYDYPFRLEDDKGPGTGGMGCFTDKEIKLPFMSDQDLKDCHHIMQSVVEKMKADGLFFNGVINGGFFKTDKGIKFMEFNSRFGDPEGLNILSVLKTPLSQLIKDIWHKQLREERVVFHPKASVIKYLVAKEYPMPSAEVIDFTIDEAAIAQRGVQVIYASCIKKEGNTYQTLKRSRVVGLVAVADDIVTASDLVNEALDNHVMGDLAYRRDVGSAKSLAKLL